MTEIVLRGGSCILHRRLSWKSLSSQREQKLRLKALVCKESEESVIHVRQRTELPCVATENAWAMDESAGSENKEPSFSEAMALTRKALTRTRKSLRDSQTWLNRAKALSALADDPPRDGQPAPEE